MKNNKNKAPAFKNSGYSEGGAGMAIPAMKAYNPKKKSAKADIDANLGRLRDRSSDLSINTPIGSAVINTSTQYTVGAGLKLFPKCRGDILGMTDDEAAAWNKKASQEFDMWASSKLADIRERNSFYELQEILYRAYLTDGDSFAVFRRGYDPLMPYTLRIQAIEGNRISNPYGSEVAAINVEVTNPDNGNKIVSGIEVDGNGAVVAYHVSNKVPLDPTERTTGIQWTRIAAKGNVLGMPNVLQIAHDERPEQYRGVPYLAPVIETLKQVSRYTSAELTSAIMKSFFSIFFVAPEKQYGIEDILPNGEVDDDAGEPVVDPSEYKLGPGTVNALPAGVDVKSIDQSNAQSTFEPFTIQLIKQIAAALGQPYEVIMKCFGSSYSASRAALLQAWDQYKMRRAWFSRDFCQPVYEMWLMEAVATGRIEAPGFFDDPMIRYAYCNAEWYGPSMSILDPVRDVNGANLRIASGLSTPEREAAEMTGSDFEENIKITKRNFQMMMDAGIAPADINIISAEGGETDENSSKILEYGDAGAGGG